MLTFEKTIAHVSLPERL